MKHARLNLLLILIASFLFTAASPAQEQSATDAGQSQEPIKTVIKKTRYIEPTEMLDILRLFEVETVVKPELDAIVLRGTRDNLDTALKVIESLDQPANASSSVELNVYILAASAEPTGNEALPANLKKVVTQLENLFDYRGFQLLETVYLRTRENGRAAIEGGLTTPSSKSARYSMSFDKVRKPDRHPDDPSVLRFRNFSFEYRLDDSNAAIVTDLEIPVGRTVVLGKATPDGLSQALILIAEARLTNDWNDLDDDR